MEETTRNPETYEHVILENDDKDREETGILEFHRVSFPPNPRPPNFIEDHVFEYDSPVFVIALYNGQLRILSGRTVACYQEEDDGGEGTTVYAYQVQCVFPKKFQVYAVRWLCHHFHEGAVYMLAHQLSAAEISTLKAFSFKRDSNPLSIQFNYRDENASINNNKDTAELVVRPCEVAKEYAANFQQQQQHITQAPVIVRCCISGPFVIGAPSQRLVQMYHKHTTESSQKNMRNPQHDEPQQVDNPIMNTKGCAPTNLQSSLDYDSSFRMLGCPETVDLHKNQVFLHRMMNMAAEMVTLFAMSRWNNETQKITYHSVHAMIRRDLDMFYFQNPLLHRRFLLFTHYKLAIDLEAPGSFNWLWCSFCKTRTTFKYEMALRRHFKKCHSICHSNYECRNDKCKKLITLPSEFVKHVELCDPKFAATLTPTIPLFVMDAYADFLQCKQRGNHALYLIRPGMPLAIASNKATTSRATKRKGDKNPSSEELEMDILSNRPIKESHECVPLVYETQKTYHMQTSWPAYDHPADSSRKRRRKVLPSPSAD